MRVAIAAVSLLIAILVAIRLMWAFGSFQEVNQGNFDRIELGMSRKEAYRIFRCPPGDYRAGFHLSRTVSGTTHGGESCNWIADDFSVLVSFSREDGRVIYKTTFQQTE